MSHQRERDLRSAFRPISPRPASPLTSPRQRPANREKLQLQLEETEGATARQPANTGLSPAGAPYRNSGWLSPGPQRNTAAGRMSPYRGTGFPSPGPQRNTGHLSPAPQYRSLLSEPVDSPGSGYSTPASGRGSPVHFDGSRSGSGHLSPSPAYISLRGSIGQLHSGASSPVSSVGEPQFHFPPIPGQQSGGPSINLTIKELQHEQERVQKKTFTNWINSYLSNYEPPQKVVDLFVDIKNGVMLLQLLEVLSGEPLPQEKGKNLKRVHFINNVRRALEFLESKKIKLVNINPSDIVDGKPSIVLGLIWTIILYFQIEETAYITSQMEDGQEGSGSALQKFKMSAKKALLVWAEKSITDKSGIPVKDFGKSWRDGIAFNALVHGVRPDIIDLDDLEGKTNREKLENAFSKAEAHLGIPRLLDAEDVDVEKPDEKSIMTYVAQFMKAYPDPDNIDAKRPQHPLKSLVPFLECYPGLAGAFPNLELLANVKVDPRKAAEAERKLYDEIGHWLDQTDDGLRSKLDAPIKDRNAEYEALQALKKEAKQYEEGYTKLKQLQQTGKALNISDDDMIALKNHWEKTMDNIKAMQKRLDKGLPGDLGDIARWLIDAEDLVYGDVVPEGMSNEEAAAALKDKMDKHKLTFKDADAMRKAFNKIKQEGKINGVEIPKDQLDDLGKRLSKVVLVAPHVLKKIEYEEVKHRALGLLDGAEDKLNGWSDRYGNEDEVNDMVDDYKNFVEGKRLNSTIDRTLQELKRATDAYKKQVVDPKDSEEIQKAEALLNEANSRWKPMASDLKSCQGTLDKAQKNWKKYSGLVDEFQAYLPQAEKALNGTPEERAAFFADIGKWQEKNRLLNEAGDFLTDVSTDPVAAEIKQMLANINRRFKECGDTKQEVERQETVEKTRSEYKLGVGKIADWLDNVEGLLEKEIPCDYQSIKDLLQGLEDANAQVEQVQTEFKMMSKLGQSLVKDSSQEVINKMLGTLKVLKERIIKVQKELPDAIRGLKGLLPNVESLEAGISDVSQWLESAEAILNGHLVDGNMQKTAEELEKHKALFAETTYYKSMLDNKNKVFQKIPKAKVKNVDHSQLEQTMQDLNERFKNVVFNAPIRQMKLEFAEPEETFLHNVEAAEKILSEEQGQIDRHDDLLPILERHKEVFQQSSFVPTCEKCLSDMNIICDSLYKYHPEDETLKESCDAHQQRWQTVGSDIDKMYTYLKSMPQKWDEYNAKIEQFENWMADTESSILDLQQETESGDEYKSKVKVFKNLVNDIDGKRDDVKTLINQLDTLLKEYSDDEASPHHAKLEAVINRYKKLMPEVDSTDDIVQTKVQCYDYKEDVEKKKDWLGETKKSQESDDPYDDIEKVRKALDEQEKLMARLDSEKPGVYSEIEAGKSLSKQQGATGFMPETVQELEADWNDTATLADKKHQKLKDHLHRFEDYKGARNKILDFLKNAENECMRSPSPGSGQDNLQKQLKAKEQFLENLRELGPIIEEMEALNNELQTDASDKGKSKLQDELDGLSHRLQNVSDNLNDKADELDNLNNKWFDFYQKMDDFGSWLSDSDERLQKAMDPRISPEEQYNKAKVICSEIYDNHEALEDIEKLARELTQNYRSRENAPIKSKLATMRKQWETLCGRAKEKNQSLSTNVTHWQVYQNKLQLLMPWIEGAQKYLNSEVAKCGSLEDAQDLYDKHQAFLSERDENNDIFEKLNEEASYITDQPTVQAELQKLNRKWNNLMVQSDDRTLKIDKAYSQWEGYDKDCKTFDEMAEKMKATLVKEPNYDSIYIPTLEQELSSCKALQEELRSQTPRYNAMVQSFQTVKPMINPASLPKIEDAQKTRKNLWEDLNKEVADRIDKLNGLIDERKTMYDKMDDFDKWSNKMHKKIIANKEIYADEVVENQARLHDMIDECNDHEPDFNQLTDEIKELIKHASPEDAKVLQEKLTHMMSFYGDIDDTLAGRSELCEKWDEYYTTRKEAEDRMKELEEKIKSPDFNKADAPKVVAEIEAIKAKLSQWDGKSSELDDMMEKSHLKIKERGGSQKGVKFGDEVQIMFTKVDDVMSSLSQKEAHLDQVDGLMSEFLEKKEALLGWLGDADQRAEMIRLAETSPEGVQALKKELRHLGKDISAHSPEYQQLKELAEQLAKSDPAKAAEIMAMLAEVEKAWEGLDTEVTEKEAQAESAEQMMVKVMDAEASLSKLLYGIEPVMSGDLAHPTEGHTKDNLEKHKLAELDMVNSQEEMDALNAKVAQLLEEGKNIPGFDGTALKERLAVINDKWQTSQEKIAENKNNLDSQMSYWDQIKATEDELTNWLDGTMGRLEDSAAKFDDVANVEGKVDKYKGELPYYAEKAKELRAKITELEALGGGKELEPLKALLVEIEGKFARAQDVAETLEDKVEDYTQRRNSVTDEMDELNVQIAKAREELAKCDDLSGTPEEIAARLAKAREIHKKLKKDEDRLAELKGDLTSLNSEFDMATEAQTLAKDGTVLAKKYDNTMQRAEKVGEGLETALEQQHQEAQHDQQRWLNAATEKVAWCGDISGDKYSIEAKLATINELLANLRDGEGKTELLAEKARLLKSVLPPEKAALINEQTLSCQDNWKEFVDSLKATKTELEGAMDQFKEYDALNEDLSQWLKDTEMTVRSDSNLKPDLKSKQEQLEKFKKLGQDVQIHKSEVADIMQQAKEITDTTHDQRVSTYANQLNTRYGNLAGNVTDFVEKFEQNCEDHENYAENYRACSDWLKTAKDRLNTCKDPTGDREAIQAKLDAVKDMVHNKEVGMAKFNSTIEGGEKLYPTTAADGREIIRQELRNLRDTWETFADDLNETQRDIETQLMQWTSYDDSFDMLAKWLDDMERDQLTLVEAKDTLPEKKSMLQHYRNQYQDILSHETIIDSVSDKAETLAMPNVAHRMEQVKARYNKLCDTGKDNVKLCEKYVAQHQGYQDSYHQARDWLHAISDRLDTCTDSATDKHTLQTRLDRVQDLVTSLQEGEAKIKVAKEEGGKTIPQTASDGQVVIRKELEMLEADCSQFKEKSSDAQDTLERTLNSLQDYDDTYDNLNHWIRDLEAQIRDHELMSTLPEKMDQVEKFKALQQEILDKQPDFDDLNEKANHLKGSESRLATYASQLNSRYQTLKNNVKDVITKWEDFVGEHQTYVENYETTSDWLNNLQHRQSDCMDTTGDKHVIEERQTKLHDIAMEKDGGISRIHQTVESGERLYPNTAAVGRDQIRHELRTLREQWDGFCDQISDTQHKLDTCIHQWSSYDDSYDQFTRWMNEAEGKMTLADELHATLPEKKAQLQNHKVLHQDILSHRHTADALTDKAHALIQATSDPRVKDLVANMTKQYAQLCDKSKGLQHKYEQNVAEHQTYQDVNQDCLECLNILKERTSACADTSGDKHTVQIRLDRLKDVATLKKESETKLQHLKDCINKVEPNASKPGQEILKQDLLTVESENGVCSEMMDEAKTSLEKTLSLWQDYDDSYDALSGWIKNMEHKTRDYELKSTLKEKQEQVEKFKALKEEIIAKEADVDEFQDKAQALMDETSDARLNTYVMQLTNRYHALLNTVKELITKWDRYVDDHIVYEDNYHVFVDWLSAAEEKLDDCADTSGDKEAIEEKKQVVQSLMLEKEHGLMKLNSAIETGEKLYPDTAAAGREKIRQELRTAKEDWDHLLNGLNDASRKFESYLNQLESYSETQDQLVKWINDTEQMMVNDKELKNTLVEKREQLHQRRASLQDINSHHRVVDAAIEKAQNLQQGAPSEKLSQFIHDVSSKYENLKSLAKEAIQESEHQVLHHQQYHDSFQTASDWLNLMKDRAAMCNDVAGDKHAVQNRLDRLKDLLKSNPEGEEKIQACVSLAEQTSDETAPGGKQTINREVESLKQDWEDYTNMLNGSEDALNKCLEQWGHYEDSYEKLAAWIKDMERKVKDFNLQSTLEEKQSQAEKFSSYMQAIRAKQPDFDEFSEQVHSLTQSTSETRVTSQVSQLSNRYQSLQVAVKEIVKKCEQNVSEHELYKESYSDCSSWLRNAKEKSKDCTDLSGSRAELDGKQDQVNELLRSKEVGFAKLNATVESGEKLYPNTASEGRETVRQELRGLKLEWENLYDELTTAQRKLETNLMQWTSIDDSFGQLEDWMKNVEGQLSLELLLKSTLEEKKVQLQSYKTLHQDVQSYQRVIDGVSDKAQALASSSGDQRIAAQLSDYRKKYNNLCSTAKDYVKQYEDFVREHQQYYDGFVECRDWLCTMKERLSMCADVSGDRHAVQSRLERIQDMMSTKLEGDPRVNNIVSMSERVIPNTATTGRDTIIHEVDSLKADWATFISALSETKADLENSVAQWKAYDESCDTCSAWLKETEHKLRDVELKPTLPEKQAQLEKLKALHANIVDHQDDFDTLTDRAQAVVRTGGDKYVSSQASQLNTRYETLCQNIKELLRRWDQYVIDNQNFCEAFDACKAWQNNFNSQLDQCLGTDGDRDEIGSKLVHLQDLANMRDDGFRKLQTAADNLQMVLPNTSSTGRDQMRRDMQSLQQSWDNTMSQMNENKGKLENCLSQLSMYDEGSEQLAKWLNEMENSVKLETELQATLSEKKSQLERVKILQLNINSHLASVNNLNEKAAGLQAATSDTSIASQVNQQVARYEVLMEKVGDLVRRCDNGVTEHQEYKDIYAEAYEWVNTAKEKLASCSDTRGDRCNIEAKLQKVESLMSASDTGKNKLQDAAQKGDATMINTNDNGKEMIREELRALKQDYDTYTNSVDDVLSNLDKLLHQWIEYEDKYNELNDWLKETQLNIKTDSDLKATLKEKNDQLKQHKAKHEEIVAQQAMFDVLSERAQSLLQNSGDPKVSTQLSQLNARFAALSSVSKDMLKKFETNMEDHHQYKESYAQCLAWLNDTEETLSVCADTSGDKYSIQSQLEKLQEFVVLKEEGQGMIHTTNSLGEKTMTNTNLEGRDYIRQELHALQRDWDEFVANISDTKITLETCLLQWTDFDDNNDQVLKWLKDMEKKVRETEPKVDLSEKKVQLQKAKGQDQDIVSHQHMIDSVLAKAQELEQKSPGSQLASQMAEVKDKYDALKDMAEDAVKKNEQMVEDHQAYQESCANYNSWLRGAREKLAACSDVYGDKDAVKNKIDRTKALEEAILDGEEKLEKAVAMGEKLLPDTSLPGQNRIRAEIDEMQREFNGFKNDLDGAEKNLDDCLDKWGDFETGKDEFSDWMNDTGAFLKGNIPLQPTLKEKKELLEKYQDKHQEILDRQNELDEVNQRAQTLLETNADARISHNITQLTTKYQGLVSQSMEQCKKLESNHGDHSNYQEAMDDYNDWLLDTQEKLRKIDPSSKDRGAVDAGLSNIMDLQASLDQGHCKLRNANTYGEKTIPNTSREGVRQIRKDLDEAKVEYDKLKVNITEDKAELEKASSKMAELDRTQNQVDTWLKDLEAKMKQFEDDDGKGDKRSKLEKYKAMMQDLFGHDVPIEKLREMLKDLKGTPLGDKIEEMLRRYDEIMAECQENVDSLSAEVANNDQFKKEYATAMEYVQQARQKLGRLSDTTGDKHDIQARISKLGGFGNEFDSEQSKLLQPLLELSEKMMDSLPPAEREKLRKEIEELKKEFGGVGDGIHDAKDNMENCVLKWKEYQDEKDKFARWLRNAEADLKGVKDGQTSLEDKQKAFRQCETIHDDISNHKPDLDKLTELAQAIRQNSLDPQVSNEMMQMSTKYQSLLSTAKDLTSQMEQAVKDQRAYEIAYADCAQWLEGTADQLLKCHDTSGDWQEIEGRIDSVREINANLDNGHGKLNQVCEFSQKVLRNATPEGRKKIQEQIDKLKEAWDNLQGNINICSTNLEKSLIKYNEYEESYDLILKWMLDIENLLLPEPEHKVDLMEKKQQLDKYKAAQTDINYHNKQIDDLVDVAKQIQASHPDKELNQSVFEMKDNYDKLKKRSNEIVKKLQGEYDEHRDYQEGLQDCEKWILQMSFRIMSHNALNVSSMELCKKQIEKHSALMREVKAYKSTIDKQNRKGDDLIVHNDNHPQLETEVKTELDNLDDSYQALQATSEQIRDRLQDILEKWMEYQQLVDKVERVMDQDMTIWWVGKRKPQADSIEHAHIQMHETKEMLQKLQGYKQDLANAAHQCENVGSMESLDQLDKNDSPLARRADGVNATVQDNIDRVNDRLEQLQNLVKEWENVGKMKADFRDWLRHEQAEVKDIADRPAKLHSDAADLEKDRLKALKEAIERKEPMLEDMLAKHRALTQHDPSLRDPVIKALQDDYDETLGRVNNLLQDREQAAQSSRDYQKSKDSVDGDMDALAAELEAITRQNASQLGSALGRFKDGRSSSLLSLHTQLTDTGTQTPRNSATQTRLSLLNRGSVDDTNIPLSQRAKINSRDVSPVARPASSLARIGPSPYATGTPFMNGNAADDLGTIDDEYGRLPGGLRNSGDKVGLSQQFWPYRSTTDTAQKGKGKPPKGSSLSGSLRRVDAYSSQDTGIGDVYGSMRKPGHSSLSPDRMMSSSPLRFSTPDLRVTKDYDDDDSMDTLDFGMKRGEYSPHDFHTGYLHPEDIPTFDDFTQTVPIDNMSTQTPGRRHMANRGAQTGPGSKQTSRPGSARSVLSKKLDDMAQQVEKLKHSVEDLQTSDPKSLTSPDKRNFDPYPQADETWSSWGDLDSDKERIPQRNLGTQTKNKPWQKPWKRGVSDSESERDPRHFGSQTPGHAKTQTPSYASVQTPNKIKDFNDYLRPSSRGPTPRNYIRNSDTESYGNWDSNPALNKDPRLRDHMSTQTPKGARTQTPYGMESQTDPYSYMDSPTQTMNQENALTQTPSHSHTQTSKGKLHPHDLHRNKGTPRGTALKSLLDTIKNMSHELEENNKARAYDSGFSSDKNLAKSDRDSDVESLRPKEDRPWLKYVNKPDSKKRSSSADKPRSRSSFPPPRSRDSSPAPGKGAPKYSRPPHRSSSRDMVPVRGPRDRPSYRDIPSDVSSEASYQPPFIPAYHVTPVQPYPPPAAFQQPAYVPSLPSESLSKKSPSVPNVRLSSRDFVRDYDKKQFSPERPGSMKGSMSDLGNAIDDVSRAANDLRKTTKKLKTTLDGEVGY
ncbi:muscle-specific protein 300 kDa-like isoform X3 [Lineus longissimus]|uniref:muscle-specific protein 300 kDa-like isoform X3 n=1 Tax=Lineus longissimus TaxID=88925 RepID=UPI00315C5E9D